MWAETQTVYPSARAILTHKLGCRGDWWRLYWSEGGAELTLYQDGEGPQEARDIVEALEWIGGDQPAELNPGTIKWVNKMPDGEREQVLLEILAGVDGDEPTGEEQAMLYGVYVLGEGEWRPSDGPLSKDEAEKLRDYRQEQYRGKRLYKADVLTEEWAQGATTALYPAEWFITEGMREAVYEDEDSPDEEWWEGY